MQNFRISAIAAFAALACGTAHAQTAAFRAEAKLATPASTPQEATIGGALWRCDGEACVGDAALKANLDGPVRECKKVVAVVGPVSAYRSGGRELSAGQVRACNKSAAQLQTAAK